ncbi:MAG: hypothetical protein OER95_18535 [Acidimicrobiia bacterium]|nr:hypothetical protein [Acidimicrobiia bacterium]
MTDRSTVPSQESEPEAHDSDTSEADARDLSLSKTPQAWFEAERESPQAPEFSANRVKQNTTVAIMPRKISATALFLAGLVATLVTGSAWATAEMLGLFESAWLTIPAGLLIALIIRAGCGRDDAEGRATTASIAYVITLLIVLGVLTRREIHEIYGNAADVLILEENLFRRRFSRIDQLAAYVIGWAVAWFGSIWLRN